jgi:hypothetical protein
MPLLLCSRDQAYEILAIKDEAELIANLKEQLQTLNKVEFT